MKSETYSNVTFHCKSNNQPNTKKTADISKIHHHLAPNIAMNKEYSYITQPGHKELKQEGRVAESKTSQVHTGGKLPHRSTYKHQE